MMRFLALLAATTALAVPGGTFADTPSLMTKRANSCGGTSFEQTFRDGVADGYVHRRFQIPGPTYIGEAILEWCQTAQNAVIYFYVDDPGRKEHAACPESMSLAVFPGRGDEVEKIIKANLPSYDDPAVKVIEKATVGPLRIAVDGRTIDAFKLEAVIVDSAGSNRRQKMIGYEADGDFVRVMTGVVEGKDCTNDVSAQFMTTLKWP